MRKQPPSLYGGAAAFAALLLLAAACQKPEPSHDGRTPGDTSKPAMLQQTLTTFVARLPEDGQSTAEHRGLVQGLLLKDPGAWFARFFTPEDAQVLAGAYAEAADRKVGALHGFLAQCKRAERVRVQVKLAPATTPAGRAVASVAVHGGMKTHTDLFFVTMTTADGGDERRFGYFAAEGDALRFVGVPLRELPVVPAEALTQTAEHAAPIRTALDSTMQGRALTLSSSRLLLGDKTTGGASREVSITAGTGASFGPGGSELILCTEAEVSRRMVDEPDAPVWSIPEAGCRAPEVSPGGHRVAYARGNRVVVRRVRDGAPVMELDVGAHVDTVTWRASGGQLMAASGGRLSRWDVETQKRVRVLPAGEPKADGGHSAVAPKAPMGVTASGETLQLWDIDTGALLASARRMALGAGRLALSSNGSILAVQDGERVVVVETANLQPIGAIAAKPAPVGVFRLDSTLDLRLGGDDGGLRVAELPRL